MKALIFSGLFLLGIFGVWLIFWDIVDWATQGLNEGIWDTAIIANGLPSIVAGIVIVAIVLILGVKVIFK
jgi:hypothetical protein